MAKRITAIPATIGIYKKDSIEEKVKRRVCGYARVSTEDEEQQSSYDAQMDYYTSFIQGHEEWTFIGMYSDEGKTGTNTKKRKGFKQMIDDALDGKIDLIITKSVSRFARNTVDSLTTVRQLKDIGVEIYFEKENIWTLDSKGELLITIMSSLAQEESRSISENTTWGQRRRFADGRASVAFKRFLGYDKGKGKCEFIVNPEQAEIVKTIYALFMAGLSFHSVATELTKRGIAAPGGGAKWHQQTVKSILTNEKYKGDALLQKTYTVNFLSKKMKKNDGEVPQFYVEGNHEAIISPETFDEVQAEIQKRENMSGRYSGVGPFSCRIKCGECGNWYGSKVWHSTDKYRKVIYQCNHKFENDKRCRTPNLSEEEIKVLFVRALNMLVLNKEVYIKNLKVLLDLASNTEPLQKELSEIDDEITVLVEMTQNIISENARIAIDQEEYDKRYNSYIKRYENKKKRHDELVAQIAEKNAKAEGIKSFIKNLQKLQEVYSEFDEHLWESLVDFMTIYNKDDVHITFKSGQEITLLNGKDETD